MALALGIGFVFEDSLWLGYTVRLWAFGLNRTFGRALRMQECAIVLGSCGFRGSRGGGSGGTVRSAGKSWKLGGGKVLVFLLVSRECSRGKEIPTWSSVVPHGWI